MGIVSFLRVGTVYAVLCGLLFLAPRTGAAVELYPIRFASPVWDMSLAYDINTSGHAVGVRQTGGSTTGFLYRNKNVTDICPAGWTDCAAASIADDGTIGGGGTDGGTSKGFVLRNGSYATVAPPGWTSTTVLAVNDSGQSAGYGVSGGTTMGFRHDGGGSYVFFLPLGYTQMRAEDMNSSGDVVGYGITGGVDKAFLYRSGTMSDPSPPGWTNTRAKDINDGGDIVGVGENGGLERCFLRRGGVFMEVLPPGWKTSNCDDINGPGEIVGSGRDAEDQMRRFVYRKGKYHVVEGLFFILALSDSGMVAGAETLDFATLDAVAAYLLPDPDITSNGKDGLVEIGPAQAPNLAVALAGFGFTGRPSDWWVFAQTPSGPRTFDIASRRWLPGFRAAAVMPLRDVKGAKLPSAGSAPGFYTYFFGADILANGRVDVKYLVFDSVSVFVR